MFIRIDERLVHGQVVTAWLNELRLKNIYVIDDSVAKNPLLQKVLKMAVPSGVELHILTVADVIADFDAKKYKEGLILCKTPTGILEIMKQVDFWDFKLNLGNSGKTNEREKLFSTFYVTQAEKDAINQMKEKQVEIFYQMVPSESKKMI